MWQRENQQLVIDKISEILDATEENHAVQLTEWLDRANRVFIAGAGRSKLVGNFLAMRLMHAGYEVSVVGEIVTPSIKEGDLLIVISGSGETEQLIAFTKRALTLGSAVALITAKSESTIGNLSGAVFQVGSTKSYVKIKGMPMGTAFELSTLVFLEAVISHIIWEKDVPEEEMQARHANLE